MKYKTSMKYRARPSLFIDMGIDYECPVCVALQIEKVGSNCRAHTSSDKCPDCSSLMVWSTQYRCWECLDCDMLVEDDRDAFNFTNSDYN